MQTTRTKTNLARLAKALLFIGLAVLLDVGLCLALQPYGTSTEIMWHDFRTSADEDIDTLILGGSYAQLGINPEALDEGLGSHTFNMATFSQSFISSLDSFELAASTHNLDRVIVCVGIDSMTDIPQYDRQIPFMQAKSLGEPLPSVLRNVSRIALNEDYFGTSKSLSWMFPWAFESVDLDGQAISKNISNRLSGKEPKEFVSSFDPDWHYVGHGYCGHERMLNESALSPSAAAFSTSYAFNERNLRDFRALLEACAARGCKAYVVAAPRPDFVNIQLQSLDYRDSLVRLRDFATSCGAAYLDLNLAKGDFFDPSTQEFTDSLHLNLTGATHFSKTLGTLIARTEANEDTSDLMYTYDEWNDWLASYDKLAMCTCDTVVDEGQIKCTAKAICQPNVEVEYAFDIVETSAPKEGAAKAHREFAADPSLVFSPPRNGRYSLSVTARVKGSDAKEDTRAFSTVVQI